MALSDINWSAVLSSSSGNVTAGYGACRDSTGVYYVVATTANLALADNQFSGIILTNGTSSGTVRIQFTGEVDNAITGLGTGLEGYVALDSTGRLVRSPLGAGVVVGRCDTKGNLSLQRFSSPTGAGVFTYRKGGTRGGNVYTSFYDAAQASIAVGGYAQLVVDGVNCPNSFPPSASDSSSGVCGLLDLRNVDIISGPNPTATGGSGTAFTFEDGTTVVGFRRIDGLVCANTSSVPVCSLDASSPGPCIRLRLDNAAIVGGSPAPFFHITTAAPGATNFLELNMGEDTFLVNGGTTDDIIQADAGTYAFIFASGKATVSSNVLYGAGDFYLEAFGAGVVFPYEATARMTGVYSVTRDALARNVVTQFGATGARPAATRIPSIGYQWFDTTLGYTITWNGTIWVNSAGVGV